MTVGTPAWLNASGGSPTYDAAELRAIDTMYAMYDGHNLGARQGVRPGGNAAVLSVATMTWTVQPGIVSVSGIVAGAFGEYRVPILTAETGTVPARDATFDRKDIVIVRVYDADNGDASREATVEYLTGTPSATPVAPTLPGKSVLLGTITVPKTSPGNPLTVTLPQNRYTVAAGGILPADTRPSSPYAGQAIFNLSNGVTEIYNGTGWVPLSTGTPAFFTQTVAGGGTWVKPANMTYAVVEIWGGGGASGGCGVGTGFAEGGGGGGGGYVRKIYAAADLSATEAFTIGAGGVAVSGAQGGDAGDTTFKGLIAGGGDGGEMMVAGSAVAQTLGGKGGVATGGDYNLNGGDGGNGKRHTASSVNFHNVGGMSPYGGATVRNPNFVANNGTVGQVPGGGAAGSWTSNTARPGSNGAVGKIIVTTYFS